MRAIVVKTNNEVYEANIETYKDYYKHLECSLFDVVMVEWFGERISIYVDDEGMLKSGNYGRGIVGYPQPLFGNLVICGGVDAEGNTLGLPKSISIEDVKDLIEVASYVVR